MVDDSYRQAVTFENKTDSISATSNQSFNLAQETDDNRKQSQAKKVELITDTKEKVKEYSGNVARLNQKLYNMRNGDAQAARPEDKVGTFDATLYL